MSETQKEELFLPLPTGEALAAGGLRLVTAGDQTTVVLLAGPVASGKTTIIVSLYELFSQGPVGGILFGGSATLAGLERICHGGRVASGGSVPKTVRTNPNSGATFLHFRLADFAARPPAMASILISDVTGEAFQEARDVAEPTIVPKALWRRANLICLVLDGERIAVQSKRHVVRTEANSLLRAARESGLIAPHCRLCVVTTKWDVVTNTDAQDFVAETETRIQEASAETFSAISFHRIAARPTSNRVPYAYGVPGLLTDWLSRAPARSVVKLPTSAARTGFRAFARGFWAREASALSRDFHVV